MEKKGNSIINIIGAAFDIFSARNATNNAIQDTEKARKRLVDIERGIVEPEAVSNEIAGPLRADQALNAAWDQEAQNVLHFYNVTGVISPGYQVWTDMDGNTFVTRS